ncbi:hypothetical protein [Martelella alba]|uniref:hypothetical protein n=1 Tax=Martelella alba TaxID=2590451 RepID=UPI0015E86149|nr:hypothetical protein [Martelella alba]
MLYLELIVTGSFLLCQEVYTPTKPMILYRVFQVLEPILMPLFRIIGGRSDLRPERCFQKGMPVGFLILQVLLLPQINGLVSSLFTGFASKSIQMSI